MSSSQETPEILVLSTYAEDSMVYMETGETDTRAGGPAHWIEETYKRMEVPHRLITSGIEVTVKMELYEGVPAPGKVYTHGSKIIVENEETAEGILINYLDDFDIDQIRKLNGIILFDIAPLTRTGEFRTERKSVELPPADIRSRIEIIKANCEEHPHLPVEWVEEQKQERVYIHTRGKEGLDLWVRGERIHFPAPPEKPKNVLGAGDTFGAAFLFAYITNGRDGEQACKSALAQVRELFIQKAA